MSDDDRIEESLRDWGKWARDAALHGGMSPAQAPRRHRAAIIAATCAGVLIVAGVIALVYAPSGRHSRVAVGPSSPTASSPSATLPPPICPALHTEPKPTDRGGSVPAPPSGIDTGNRLVPNRAPNSVVVCAYTGTPMSPTSTRLHGDLSRISTDLSKLGGDNPNAANQGCLDYLALTDRQYFLLGLRFGDGVVWIAAPGNHCDGSSNGATYSRVNLRADAQQAYRTGLWDTDPLATSTCARASNQGPDARPLIPDGAIGLTLCANLRGASRAYRYPASDVQRLQLANTLSPDLAQITPPGCTIDHAGRGILLILSYPNRPDIVIAATPTCANGQPGARQNSYDLANSIVFFDIERL